MPDAILCQMENRVFFIPGFRDKGGASNINQSQIVTSRRLYG